MCPLCFEKKHHLSWLDFPQATPWDVCLSSQESQDRRDAIGFLFHTLDADGDQRLNLPELERFAAMCGFSGEWQTEYEAGRIMLG